MKNLSKWGIAVCLAAGPVWAADYKCSGNRVEKGNLTQYTVRFSGADLAIEKGGLTRGRAVRRGDVYAIEVSDRTVATVDRGRIYKGGLTWTTVAETQRVYDCPDIVAAALWVLEQRGEL